MKKHYPVKNSAFGCKGRIRTYKKQLADTEVKFILYLHPRDRRACLPVSSPYNKVAVRVGVEPTRGG